MGLQRALPALLLLAACAGDPPPAAETETDVRTWIVAASSTEEPSDESRETGDVEGSEGSEATTTRSAFTPACEPGETRACKVYWTYENVQHCFVTTQRCRDDGRDWQACGN